MKKIIKAKRPSGFLDFLPAEYLAREKMIKTIDEIFRLFGFDPTETPIVERLETLAGEKSDTGKNIFLIKNAASTDKEESLALRFDQTIPFARLLANNPYDSKRGEGIKLPWRRMSLGPVFRGERPQVGRYRQFYQFDADIVGSESMLVEAEIIHMICKVFKALKVGDFVVKINNRKILNGLSQLVGIKSRGKIKAEDITKEMMRILDKIDKIGVDKALTELQKAPTEDNKFAPNLSKENALKVKAFLNIKGTNYEKLDQCQEIFAGVAVAEAGILELKQILDYLLVAESVGDFIEINFSIARGLDYYTGPVLETVLLKAPEFGSLCSGGRYNSLVSRFTGEDLPAVGMAIGIDRLFAALVHLNKINQSKDTVTEVMVLRLMPHADNEYLRIADELRDAGMKTEICLLNDTTFKRQFNFAVSKGVDYVIIYGEDESVKQMIQIKNLKTREQKEVSRGELSNIFKK